MVVPGMESVAQQAVAPAVWDFQELKNAVNAELAVPQFAGEAEVCESAVRPQ